MPKTLTTDEVIDSFRKIWGDKYDYSYTEYINSTTKVSIKCYKHGIFTQIIGNHRKYGCGKCGKENNKGCISLKTEAVKNFPCKAIALHGDKYTYEKSIYVDSHTKLIVTCKIHGDFLISPNNHLMGKGCKTCGIERAANSKIKLFEEYYPIFIKLYGDKYDYSETIWTDGSTPIIIRCKTHGYFTKNPYEHKKGQGCQKCTNQYSKMSIEWLTYISKKNGLYIQHAENGGEYIIPILKCKVDGYCKENNTVYEFLGDFWHGNPDKYDKNDINPKSKISYGSLLNKTIEKRNKIIKMGYTYMEIWETDWKIFKTENNISLIPDLK